MQEQQNYKNNLSKLKKEIKEIKKKKKKKFKRKQQDMIHFIHNIARIEIEILGKKILLKHGNLEYGFKHILNKHYNKNDLATIDILNFFSIVKKVAKLNEHGVTNPCNDVYKASYINKEYKIIVHKQRNEIVTFYRIS